LATSCVNMPTDVIFGCAVVVTVPDVSAYALTLAKLTSNSLNAMVPACNAKMYGTVIVIISL
jgi:hypothetical protein